MAFFLRGRGGSLVGWVGCLGGRTVRQVGREEGGQVPRVCSASVRPRRAIAASPRLFVSSELQPPSSFRTPGASASLTFPSQSGASDAEWLARLGHPWRCIVSSPESPRSQATSTMETGDTGYFSYSISAADALLAPPPEGESKFDDPVSPTSWPSTPSRRVGCWTSSHRTDGRILRASP